MDCHRGYDNLNLDRNQNFPHYVDMVGDAVSLDQMIHFRMINLMKGRQFEQNSKELTAMAPTFAPTACNTTGSTAQEIAN